MSRTATAPGSAAALRAEIAQTRADLGQTVQALAAKADVRARVAHAVAERRARVAGVLSRALDQTSARMRVAAAGGHHAGDGGTAGVAQRLRTADRMGLLDDDGLAPALRRYWWLVPAGAATAAAVAVAARRGRR
ncbi:MAG TPA: DUF3618 domain-containing protein [Pilimelia sp.]|nr:DUF3618 domain-containing protein [Pilimelia sp.]